ncbi:hypothetical protein KQX54_018696 [Cotesia glomerata]|uniref:Uncharacterized protein n=1 Tax=Cotesia glomerata TaxID=32391 RepID=A0AAV7HZH5_COTGL|nr:hypothetical protein KQX54_018696 [Cotesia glomerata]
MYNTPLGSRLFNSECIYLQFNIIAVLRCAAVTAPADRVASNSFIGIRCEVECMAMKENREVCVLARLPEAICIKYSHQQDATWEKKSPLTK